jgi:hypothetical protein
MTHHVLQGQSGKEIFWFQRRSFLKAAAAWSAMGGYVGAQAQTRSNIVELLGDATLNGARLNPQQIIQTGDQITTGPNSNLIFVVGNTSFHVRENSMLTVERGSSLNTVSVLRLLNGAVASVWGKGNTQQIITPTITADIRGGTGVYAEVFANEDGDSYFCNCYGTVDLRAGDDRLTSQADYHQSFYGKATPQGRQSLTPACVINHTDEELEFLAHLVDQRTTWQAMGKKGVKDGKGYMDKTPSQMHPAEKPRRQR